MKEVDKEINKQSGKSPQIKQEPLSGDSRHPLSFEVIHAAAKQIRGLRFIQSNCAEHPALLARFFLYGDIIPSSSPASTFTDYPYQRNFEIEMIKYKTARSHYVIVERDNILLRHADSKIISYLPIQFEAIKTEDDCIFSENKDTYQSTYCSIEELPRKLEQMAGMRGWVGAVISLSRMKKCKNEKEAQVLRAQYQRNPKQFDHSNRDI